MIVRPTLLLDSRRVERNIATMARKVQGEAVRWRPHMKTHQSAQIAELFRHRGVEAITVSSLSMAKYFADHGWRDILVAFPVNLLERELLVELASCVHLGLLVDSPLPLSPLASSLESPVDLWIKIDVGYRRAGLSWDDEKGVLSLAEEIMQRPCFRFRGFLTHGGQTYSAGSPERIREIFRENLDRMNSLKRAFSLRFPRVGVEISVGDTPGCRLAEGWRGVDEVRPGNFVFYDLQQLSLGVCSQEEIALAVACPVASLYPERSQGLLYGGAVHLSKDTFLDAQGRRLYGWVVPLREEGWGRVEEGGGLLSLSQEHGLFELTPPLAASLRAGGLAAVLPAHSCLAVSALGAYQTLDGKQVERLREV